MHTKTVHEAEATLMSADDVWEDAQLLADLLESNELRSEPKTRLQMPLSAFLSALEQFTREELTIVGQRVEERLAA